MTPHHIPQVGIKYRGGEGHTVVLRTHARVFMQGLFVDFTEYNILLFEPRHVISCGMCDQRSLRSACLVGTTINAFQTSK